MRHLIRSYRKDERGVTLAVSAVMIVSLLSMIALAFDLGLLFTARGEAQRAADSAALAGAQEFLHFNPPTLAVTPATNEAMAYATSNQIRNVTIVPSEVTVQVNPTLRRVHVFIRRNAIPMWFARLLGFATVPIAASAMAQASPASIVNCMAPLALPDWWHDPNDDDGAGGGVPGNRVPDGGENWSWGDDPSTETYEAFNYDASINETGLASLWRTDVTRDQGRLMIIKSQLPGNNPHSTNPVEIKPGWFYPIRLPGFLPGTTNQGAKDYRDSFYDCNSGPIAVGDTIDLEMGNMKGPTYQAIDSVVAMDPTAYWDAGQKKVISPYGWDSPRILTITLFPPQGLMDMGGGNHTIQPNNFAKFFVEGRSQGGNQAEIVGRFLEFAQGSGGGPTGTLVLKLQLIQ